MKPEACIFDLDGVLVDTAKYHFLAWKRLADHLGIPFNENQNERLKGVSRMKSLDIILELGDRKASDDEKSDMASMKNEWFVEYILQMTPEEILPGVLDFFEVLDKNGIKKGMGSASKNAATVLKQIGLKDSFEAIVDGNLISKAKPDPEVFLTCAKLMDVSPSVSVVFEDAIAGVQAAHNGKMKCVGVGKQEILGEAEIVISTFNEISLEKLKSLYIQ